MSKASMFLADCAKAFVVAILAMLIVLSAAAFFGAALPAISHAIQPVFQSSVYGPS